MAAVQVSAEAARRIAAATRKVERTPVDRTGDRSNTYAAGTGFWATIFGSDVSGIRYTSKKVIFGPLSAMPEAFTVSSTLRFSFDGEAAAQVAVEVNATRGIKPFTVVWVTFAGYGSDGEPVCLFSHPQQDAYAPITPHDHRDNFNGGHAFSMFHPGTGIPQSPWAV